jgi:hypothetical protein
MNNFDETPLQVIDKELNKYGPVLFTLFNNVRKDWQPGHHVIFKPKGSNSTVKLYCTHSPSFKNTENSDHYIERIDGNTLIMDLSNNEERTVVFYYKRYRNNPLEYTYITIDDDSFTVKTSHNCYTSNYAESPIKYPLLFQNSKKKHYWQERTELECFRKCSLVALEKLWFKNNKELKSKGGKQGIKAKLIFDNAGGFVEDIKDNLLDAYKIAITYGFKGVYKTFYRQMIALKNGACLCLSHPNGKSSLECYLLDEVHNYKTYIENSGILKEDNRSFIVMDIKSKDNQVKEPEKLIEKEALIKEPYPILHDSTTDDTKLYTEWKKQCEDWNNDPEMCWSFEEYKEICVKL